MGVGIEVLLYIHVCRNLTVTTKVDVDGPQLPTLARTVTAPFRALLGRKQTDYTIINNASGVISPVGSGV